MNKKILIWIICIFLLFILLVIQINASIDIENALICNGAVCVDIQSNSTYNNITVHPSYLFFDTYRDYIILNDSNGTSDLPSNKFENITFILSRNYTFTSLGTNISLDNLTVKWETEEIDSDILTNITDFRNRNASDMLLHVQFHNRSSSNETEIFDYSSRQSNGNALRGIPEINESGYMRFNGTTPVEFDAVEIGDTGFSGYMRYQSIEPGTTMGVISKCSPIAGICDSFMFSSSIASGANTNLTMFILNSSQSVQIVQNHDRWNDLGFSWNSINNNFSVYLDGDIVQSAVFDYGPNLSMDGNIYIASDDSDISNAFQGLMDFFYLFNRTLNDQEIKSIYNNESGLLNSNAINKGEFWKANITVNDGYIDSNNIETDELRISGAIPENPLDLKFNATDDNNYTIYDLLAEFRLTGDIDGNAQVYNLTLFLNGSSNFVLGNLTNLTALTLELIESENTTKNDNWAFSIIQCNIPDYDCSQEIFSNNVTILNSPPSEPSLQAIANATNLNYPTSTLVFNWTNSSDNDPGDIISYIWELSTSSDFSVSSARNITIDETATPTITETGEPSGGTYFWRVIANDTDDNSTSDSFFTFIINAQSLIYNILLNGSEIDRKYEIDTNSNITATAIPAGTNFCLDLDDPDFGENFTCGTTALDINYTVGSLFDENISDNASQSLTFSNNVQRAYFNLTENGTYHEFNFNISGELNSGRYPNNLICDFEENGIIDISLPGELQDRVLYFNKFSNNLTEETIYYDGAGLVTRNFNITSRVGDLGFDYNGTINVTGAPSNPENISFNDRYHNGTYINDNNSQVNNIFVWEDFTLGEISGRYSGIYTVVQESRITNSQTKNSGSCSAESSTSTNSFNTRTLNMEEYGSTFARVVISGTGCAQSLSGGDSAVVVCGESNSGRGNALFGIKDLTTGSVTTVLSVQGGCGQGTVGSCSGSQEDSSNWEIRRVENTFEFYDDGNRTGSMNIDTTHQYELYTSNYATTKNGYCPGCSACASGIGSQGVSAADLYPINLTGITGPRTGNFTFGNATMESHQIASFSSNLRTALLSASENKPANTNIRYWMSADNGTNWEEVQNGITHLFTTAGTVLRYKIDVNSTETSDTDGDLSEQAIVKEMTITVSQGFPSNITLDIGNDGIIEWEHLENLTDESSVEANFTGSSVSTYISDNALSTDTDINVPVGIRSNSSGGIILNNIDFNLTLNQIGAGSYANNLTNIALNNGSLLLACTTEDFGRINIEDYTSRYLGDGNFTITAHLNDTNSNLTENITYRIIQARFSPINFSYPAGIESLRIAVNNGTQYNVTPIGQFINYCTSANITQGLCANMSIPFYNFSTDAKLDPVNITGYLNETLNSCITMRSRVNVTNPLGEITWNITEQTLISGAAIDANHSLFIDFDFVDCNLTTLRAINFTPIFNSYCEECIY